MYDKYLFDSMGKAKGWATNLVHFGHVPSNQPLLHFYKTLYGTFSQYVKYLISNSIMMIRKPIAKLHGKLGSFHEVTSLMKGDEHRARR